MREDGPAGTHPRKVFRAAPEHEKRVGQKPSEHNNAGTVLGRIVWFSTFIFGQV